MTDLKAMCADAGFARIETYIASGNVVFESQVIPAKVKSQLEARLLAYAGKPVGVFVRTAAEMQAVLNQNPFSEADPKYAYAFFLHEKPLPEAVTHALHHTNEDIRLGLREIYIYYPSGMGQSKLQIPAAKHGTARNMNTIAKLVAMSLQK